MKIQEKIFWILGIIVAIILALYSSEIDKINNTKGLEIYPERTNYDCNLPGLAQTITITNYDDSTKENMVFSVGWQSENNLSIEAKDIDNTQTDKIFESIETNNESYNYKSYLLTSIKPKESVRFDLLMKSNCQQNFAIYFVLNKPFEVQKRF